MIAAMILSLTLFGLLVALAAWAIERCCMRLGLPRRWTWLAAMVLMSSAPLLPDGVITRMPIVTQVPRSAGLAQNAPQQVALAPQPAHRGWWPPYGATIAFFGTLPMGAVLGVADALAASATLLRPLDEALLAAWVGASALLLLLTWHGARRLAREQRRWILRRRDGLTAPAIYVSEDVGPAAFGAGRGEIVIPRWAMSLPPLERRLLLLHERSHVEARDPRLLAIGMCLVILTPWNLPLRWAYRRMQRAIEHDCDRRVLHRPHLARRYAELLLKVAERGVTRAGWPQRALSCLGGPNVTMTSLMSGEPALESRLRTLVAPPVTWRARCDATGALASGLMLTVVACTVPIPQELSPSPLPRFARFVSTGTLERDETWLRGAAASATARSRGDSLYFARNDSLVIAAIETTQPSLLRLARTQTPYVAVALTPDNQVIAQSIRAGAPSGTSSDAVDETLRRAEAAAMAGLRVDVFSDELFRAKLAFIADDPMTYLDSLGVSHLKVGEHPLTVLWVRFKERPKV
ncbi:MAG: M56 family metallopeptidase [Gemmatimonadota bacterium]